ncbi:MAG: chromosomal replication initiator protein DnaA, partial [Epsilonproteobacteria bacterium]|nr:chromosomal replication initiator protein DnaA [Campylobacterota bacterium]
MNIGQKVLDELKKEISQNDYEKYIKKLAYDEKKSRSDQAYFYAPNIIIAKWVKTKYEPQITHLFELKTGIKPELLIDIKNGKNIADAIKTLSIEKSPQKANFLNPSLTFDTFIVGSSNQFA